MSYWQPTGAFGWPGTETVLARNVNAPLPSAPASNRPHDVAPVPIEIDAEASTFPLNVVLPSKVAELPTNHQTLEALAPLIRIILLPTAVVSAEGACRTKRAFGSPPPSRVRSPVTLIVEFEADI